jgi:hypothetical protein
MGKSEVPVPPGICDDCKNINLEEESRAPTQWSAYKPWLYRWQRICVLDWIYSTKDCPLCDIFAQAMSRGFAQSETRPQPASNCKATLVSRFASEYFDIEDGRFYDLRVLGVAMC